MGLNKPLFVMAYQGILINRQVVGQSVFYDLLITDNAGVLPDYRHSVCIPLINDTTQRKNQIINQAVNFVTQNETQAARRARITALRDEIIDLRKTLLDRQNQLQDILDGGQF